MRDCQLLGRSTTMELPSRRLQLLQLLAAGPQLTGGRGPGRPSGARIAARLAEAQRHEAQESL